MESGRWWVYLIECSDGTYYTGVTNNLKRRACEHGGKRGAKYLRGRLPARMLSAIPCEGRGAALRKEAWIKEQFPRLKVLAFQKEGRYDYVREIPEIRKRKRKRVENEA